MFIEEWKDIEGFVGKYQISSLGRVRSLDRITNNRAFKGDIKSLQKSNTGYLRVYLCMEKRKVKPFAVHRLVAYSFLNKPEGCDVVNHLDGNRINNIHTNLEWTTISGNTKHSYRTGLQVMGSGEDNPAAKYSNLQIKEVKNLISLGKTNKEICLITEVDSSSISHIRNGKTWKNI